MGAERRQPTVSWHDDPDEYARQAVADWPLLTTDQRACLRILLRPAAAGVAVNAAQRRDAAA